MEMTSKRIRYVRTGSLAAIALAAVATIPASAIGVGSAPDTLAGVVPSWVSTAHLLGVVDPAQRVGISVTLRYRDEAGLNRLVTQVSDPASPSYRHFLSTGQFNDRFSPTKATIASVSHWLSSAGLTVDGATASGVVVRAHGPASLVESALKTTLASFTYLGETVRAPIKAATIPTKLAGVIKGIAGLDTVRYHPTHQRLASPPAAFLNARPCAAYWGQITADNQPSYKGKKLLVNPCGYSPAQIRGAYGLDKVKQTGTGATVAIIDAYASSTIEADLATYSAKHGLPAMKSGQFTQTLPQPLEQNTPELATNPAYAAVGGLPVGLPILGLPSFDPEGWSGEETLDVEAVHTLSPGANIIYVPSISDQNDLIDVALLYTIEATSAQVISNSYGSIGEATTVDDKTLFDQAMSQAAAKGISVIFSSGDSGDELEDTNVRQADYPASSDMVTALGATSLFVGKNNTYLGEGYWGTRKFLRKGSGWDTKSVSSGAGGGGVSKVYAEPSWQKGVVPDSYATYGGVKPGRVLPDISIIGDSVTGFLVGQTQTQHGGQTAYSEYRIGGTSVSCPMLAGILADVIQLAGHSLGLINPALYKLAGSGVYRDIVKPKVPVAVVRYDYTDTQDPSTKLIPSLRTLGNLSTLHLVKGYDDATGLGTPIAQKFIPALAKG